MITSWPKAAAIRFAADPLIGGELEAWILTGEPRPAVAELSGVDEPVIEAYEQCFFDVRPKLDAWSYIIHIVIGPGVYEGFRLDDLAPIWKTYRILSRSLFAGGDCFRRFLARESAPGRTGTRPRQRSRRG